MMGGKLIERNYPSQHYRMLFDQRTGFFVRKEDPGYPEPTWAADGPELIDLSITNYCERGCKFCYRETRKENALFMDLGDVEAVVEQAEKCGTVQIALGGGNPNQHPQFVEVLRIIREHDIVPSYTTNGDGLTDEVLKATAEYCGAMAVSVYPPFDETYYERLIMRIRHYGIRVNLHAIIREDCLELWTKWLLEPPVYMKNVNAMIFLNYKPMGREGVSLMPKDLHKVERFFKAADKCETIKIGFDSCSMSGIVRWMNVPRYLVEPCEAARFSAFVSEDMKMYPCSFMVDKGWCGDLRKNYLVDIWQKNEYFLKFRDNLLTLRCEGCGFSDVCRGGCRLFEEINWC